MTLVRYCQVDAFTGPGGTLFGPNPPNPSGWAEANPMEYTAEHPAMPVLLVHGAADETVPGFFTEQFAAALAAGGHQVTEFYPEGVDHHAVYSAEVTGPLILEWLDVSSGG